MTEKKIQAFAANAALFLFTLFILIFLAEFLFRFRNSDQKNYNIEMWRYSKLLKIHSQDPELGHEHRPGSHAKLQGVEIRINQEGMRGPEVQPLLPGQKRILVLGSSNALAWGVPEEDSMAAQLQKLLGDRAQVLNAGIGNYNAKRYVKLFESRYLALKPDIVLVHYFVRDAEVLQTGGGNFILRNSELAVILFHLFHDLSFGSKDPSKLIEHYRAMYSEKSVGLIDMEKALDHLDKLSQTRSFRVILTMVPDIHAVTPYPFGFIHERMKKIAAEHHWTFVDFLGPLQQFPQESLWVMPGDPHINAKGQKIMAETLAAALR